MKKLLQFYVLLSVCVGVSGCGESGNSRPTVVASVDETGESQSLDLETSEDVRSLMDAYLRQIDVDLSNANNELQTLTAIVEDFLNSPTEQSAEEVRNAWLEAHNAYEANSIHRYFAQTVLSESAGLEMFELHYQLDHWPILPGYIDYVGQYPQSGIVNDMTVPLDTQVIREQHGRFDINEASTGFHVIEFLLWGENQVGDDVRPVSDFRPVTSLNTQQQSDGLELFQLSENRRREYLVLSASILNEDFQSVVNGWAANSVSYRAGLANVNAEQLLLDLLNAITGMLNEELLVRSLYPMLNGELIEGLPAVYSRSSPASVSAQLASLENLLLELSLDSGHNFDNIFSVLSEDFTEFFYQNFDASKECLVVLYATEAVPQTTQASADFEFKVVECINSLTNMIDYLEQIKLRLDSTG